MAGVRTGVSLLVPQNFCFQPTKKKKKKPQDFAAFWFATTQVCDLLKPDGFNV